MEIVEISVTGKDANIFQGQDPVPGCFEIPVIISRNGPEGQSGSFFELKGVLELIPKMDDTIQRQGSLNGLLCWTDIPVCV